MRFLEPEDSAAFWNWVCSRKAHANNRGTFIRETREIRDSHDPGEDWWEDSRCNTVLFSACSEASDEYLRFIRQFYRLQPKPTHIRDTRISKWTRRLRWKLLPYCVWRHESGQMYLVNRHYEPIWCLDTQGWHEINTPIWVHGQFSQQWLYDDGHVHRFTDDALAEFVLNRMVQLGLTSLPPDFRRHSRMTEGSEAAEKFRKAKRSQRVSSCDSVA